MSNVYVSENMIIEETPQGCYIHDNHRKVCVLIGNEKDIDAVIESLTKLKNTWYSKEVIVNDVVVETTTVKRVTKGVKK